MRITLLINITCCFLFFTSCSNKTIKQEELDNSKYDQWQADRIEGLTKPMGYLSMVGLYWLEEGENTFGSSRQNDLIFPRAMPDKIGSFRLMEDKVSVDLIKGSGVLLDGLKLEERASLKTDQGGKPSMFNWVSYFWYLIKRGDKIGLRVKDTLSEARLNFKSIPRFKTRKEWILEAEFIPAGLQSFIPITNVIGITTQNKLAGLLRFKYENKSYSLKALDGGVDRFFIIFGDQTNGDESYGGGRFLYVPRPDPSGMTTIDFNMAENPICAFNDFATCPLPPRRKYFANKNRCRRAKSKGLS